jgi:hypothetical protein
LNDKIEFHDALQGFRASRGTGTATIEATPRMQLSQKEEKTLYVIFNDLKKWYNALDREWNLMILDMEQGQRRLRSYVTFGVSRTWWHGKEGITVRHLRQNEVRVRGGHPISHHF